MAIVNLQRGYFNRIVPSMSILFKMNRFGLATGFFLLLGLPTLACTIVSGVDAKRQTWVMNNEDFLHTLSNYVNVYPAKKNTLGYITLTYGSAQSGIQGGANEAGVFFDINALPPQTYKLSVGKKPFVKGHMLVYLLQHCRTVPEFLQLWETYYMPDMTGIQIHLADKAGNLAVITPDTIVRSKKHLTSTNFTVCEPDSAKRVCWRYPIAEQIIHQAGISQASLVKIADATSWREFTTTLYTNIHNLSTGDIWFYLAEDYQHSWATNIHSLLKQGQQSILLASRFPKNNTIRLTQLLRGGAQSGQIDSFLMTGGFSNKEKESMLRLCFLDLFYMEKEFAKAAMLFPHWESLVSNNPKLDKTEFQFTKAQYLASIGQKPQALATLQAVAEPSWRTAELLNNLLGTEGTNATIMLKGHPDAKSVLLEIKGDYNFFRFLEKAGDGWAMPLKSTRNQLKYCFYVDGHRVIDSSQPVVVNQETTKGDFANYNILNL